MTAVQLTETQLRCLQAAAVDDLVRTRWGWAHVNKPEPKFSGICVNSLVARQLLEETGIRDSYGRATRVRLHELGRRELRRREARDAR